MKKELLEKKKELQKEIELIDKSLNMESLREEIEKLSDFTDTLNTMFQDHTVESYSMEASNLLYEAMQKIDKIIVGLESDLEELESEEDGYNP